LADGRARKEKKVKIQTWKLVQGNPAPDKSSKKEPKRSAPSCRLSTRWRNAGGIHSRAL
jgi:hypothetical protein